MILGAAVFVARVDNAVDEPQSSSSAATISTGGPPGPRGCCSSDRRTRHPRSLRVFNSGSCARRRGLTQLRPTGRHSRGEPWVWRHGSPDRRSIRGGPSTTGRPALFPRVFETRSRSRQSTVRTYTTWRITTRKLPSSVRIVITPPGSSRTVSTTSSSRASRLARMSRVPSESPISTATPRG